MGCEKFLDVPPTTNVAIPSTLTEYRALVYPSSAVYGYGSPNSFGGDDLYYTDTWYRTEPNTEADRKAYTWEEDIYDLVTTPTVWNNTYSYIYALNKVIAEVPSLKDDENAKQEIIAHAKMMRAWQYFHLVNTFAKPYQMAGDNDPGIPFIEANDVMASTLERTNVKEVYSKILDDLNYASEHLSIHPDVNSRYMATKITAIAIKAKVLFFMCRYQEAYTEIDNVLNIISNNPSPSGLTYGVLDFRSAVKFMDETKPYRGLNPNFPPATSFETDIENIFGSSQSLYSPAAGFYFGFMGLNACFVSDAVVNLFDSRPGDLRKAYWLFDKNTSGLPWDSTSPGKYIKKNYATRIGVTYPELLLMAAECKARDNKLPQALGFLEQVRIKRYNSLNYQALNSTDKNEVIKWCIEERIREFVGQGHRWWDMRRLWDDEVGSQTIVKNRTVEGETYTLTKERLTFRIPLQIMQYNKNWTQND